MRRSCRAHRRRRGRELERRRPAASARRASERVQSAARRRTTPRPARAAAGPGTAAGRRRSGRASHVRHVAARESRWPARCRAWRELSTVMPPDPSRTPRRTPPKLRAHVPWPRAGVEAATGRARETIHSFPDDERHRPLRLLRFRQDDARRAADRRPCARAGQRVSVVKHAHHSFDIDHEGKDSWRHRQAGASEVVIASIAAWRRSASSRPASDPTVHDLIAELEPCDWVLVEGFKLAALPKIEVWRAANGKPARYVEDADVVADRHRRPAAVAGADDPADPRPRRRRRRRRLPSRRSRTATSIARPARTPPASEPRAASAWPGCPPGRCGAAAAPRWRSGSPTRCRWRSRSTASPGSWSSPRRPTSRTSFSATCSAKASSTAPPRCSAFETAAQGDGLVLRARIGAAGGGAAEGPAAAGRRAFRRRCERDARAAARRRRSPGRPVVIDHAALVAGMRALAAGQGLWKSTGASHAAAWISPAGELLLVREDVGRRNALDKLVGAMARAGIDPASGFAGGHEPGESRPGASGGARRHRPARRHVGADGAGDPGCRSGGDDAGRVRARRQRRALYTHPEQVRPASGAPA